MPLPSVPIPINVREPVRKALIIAITYSSESPRPLENPHRDAEDWRQLLINQYGFREENIVLMLDDETIPEERQPTRENILMQIQRFVDKSKAGDKLMFYYSGHGTQKATSSSSEPDGFDEAIQPLKGLPILDNELRLRMVEPLPVGVRLTAIFDSCHSGTVLDLPHYDCNKVDYAEMTSTGSRKSRSKGSTKTKHAHDPEVPSTVLPDDVQEAKKASLIPVPSDPKDMKRKPQMHIFKRCCISKNVVFQRNIVVDPVEAKDDQPRRIIIRSSTMDITRPPPTIKPPRRTFSFHNFTGAVGNIAEAAEKLVGCTGRFMYGLFLPRAESPERLDPNVCARGNCKPIDTPERPHVISFSACHDSQMTWEYTHGRTMTQSLIMALHENPYPPIRELVVAVSKDIYNTTTKKRLELRKKQLQRWAVKRRPHNKRTIDGSPSQPMVGSMNVLADDECFPFGGSAPVCTQ